MKDFAGKNTYRAQERRAAKEAVLFGVGVIAFFLITLWFFGAH
jgi:hypothetical protein